MIGPAISATSRSEKPGRCLRHSSPPHLPIRFSQWWATLAILVKQVPCSSTSCSQWTVDLSSLVSAVETAAPCLAPKSPASGLVQTPATTDIPPTPPTNPRSGLQHRACSIPLLLQYTALNFVSIVDTSTDGTRIEDVRESHILDPTMKLHHLPRVVGRLRGVASSLLAMSASSNRVWPGMDASLIF